MTFKRLLLILFPILFILSLFLLQINHNLELIRKLPAPGWSRGVSPSEPLLSSVTPFIQQEDTSFSIYTAHSNTVIHTQLDAKLNLLNQKLFTVEGPIQSIIWGKQDDFLYEKENTLYFYKDKQSLKLASKWDHVKAAPNKVVFSKSNLLYEYMPGKKVNEIAGFASPIVSIGLTESGGAMLIATKPAKTNQYTFFLLKDQGTNGYQVIKLGYIQAQNDQDLLTSQLTEGPNNYVLLMAFKNLNDHVSLESLSLPLSVSVTTIGKPKALPFHITVANKQLTYLAHLQLSQDNGTPSLLFVSGPSPSLEDTIYEAKQAKPGLWTAEKRSDSLQLKSHPYWVNNEHNLFLWLSPKTASLNQVNFTSHNPDMAKKSLNVTGTDLLHAFKQTNASIDKMGRFLILLMLFALPSLIVYSILAKWVGFQGQKQHITHASLITFFISETLFIHFILKSAPTLPSYLLFPLHTLVFGTGLGLICLAIAYLFFPTKALLKSRVTYGITVYLLALTFLIGAYV